MPKLSSNRRLSSSRGSTGSATSAGSSAANSENSDHPTHAGYHEDTARRAVYSSGSLPDTFRTGFSPLAAVRRTTGDYDDGSGGGGTRIGESTRLPRGLSRTRLAHTYQRFPYGMVAHRAATIMQHAVRRHQQWRAARITLVQSTVRAWKAKTLVAGRREEYFAALTVMQRNARVFLARIKAKWLRSVRRARAAQRIQSLYRGNAGRVAAAAWRAFVRKRSAATLQRAWHACKGRYRATLRRYWLDDQRFRATTIQRCWRGHHHGRLRAFKIRLWAALELQRIARGMLGRLRAWSAVVFRAAADIQRTLSRGVRGRQRAARVYEARVEKERVRRIEEDKVIARAVQQALAAVDALLDRNVGDRRERRFEKRRAGKEMRTRQRAERKRRKQMSAKERTRMRVEDVFRGYDVDHDGTSATIPLECLPALVRRLCIPLAPSEIARAAELLKAPRRRGDVSHDAAGAATAPDLTPSRVRFEDFWTLLSVELGHARFDSDEEAEEGTATSGSPSAKRRLRRRPPKRNQLQAKGSVVSEGTLSYQQTRRLQARLQAVRAFRGLVGRTHRENVERFLREDARKSAVRSARASFRERDDGRRPAFECPHCLRPFVFDYEVPRHQEAMQPDCEAFDTYDALRARERAREKSRREEERVVRLAREAERRSGEAFRKGAFGGGKEADAGENFYY